MKRLLKHERPGFLALLFSALLAVIGGVIFISQANGILERHRQLEKVSLMSGTLLNLLGNMQDMKAGQQGFLLTGETPSLGAFYQGSIELRRNLASLDRLEPEADPADKEIIKKLKTLAALNVAELSRAVALREQGRFTEALTAADSSVEKRNLAAIKTLIQDFNWRFRTLQAQNEQETGRIIGDAKVSFILWMLAIAGLTGAAFWNTHTANKLLKKTSEQLAVEATHDALTGLPNRRYLHDLLKSAVSRCARQGESVIALYIDLDGFSDINNTFGHDAGDAALVWACTMIRSHLRDSDVLARLGGDEFVIISCGTSLAQVGQLAQRLIDLFSRSRPLEDMPIGSLGLSIGIAAMSIEAPDAEQLLNDADQAMYEAKRAGKRCFRFAGGYRGAAKAFA